MLCNTMSNYYPMNNLYFNPSINKKMYYSSSNYQDYMKLKYLIQQDYLNSNFNQQHNLIINKNNYNPSALAYQQCNNQSNANNSINNQEENIFKKINMIKINKRRKASIDTTVSSISYNSSTNDDNENEEKKENVLNNQNISLQGSDNNKKENKNYSKENEDKLRKNKNCDKNKEYKGNPELENTEILRVNVKISKDKEAIFKLKRYDDVFETIKLFCEINSVDEKLIKPLIIKSLSTLNTIYQIMNSKLDNKQINLLKKIQKV